MNVKKCAFWCFNLKIVFGHNWYGVEAAGRDLETYEDKTPDTDTS